MRLAMGQQRSVQGMQRAARYHSGGVNISKNRTGKLKNEEIMAGIGYKTSQGEIKQHRRHNMKKNNNTNSIDKRTDSKNEANSDIERQESQQVEQDLPCWFVQRLGNMPQDRLEGVFQLLGGI
jgi:hypothetical protein